MENTTVFDKMINLKIESAVTAQLQTSVISDCAAHYFDQWLGQEADHLSSWARSTVSKYLALWLKL